MQRIGIKGDGFYPAAVNAAGNLIGVLYRSNTNLSARATNTEWMLVALAASRSAIPLRALRSMSLFSLTESTGQLSSRATGTPQLPGGSAYSGETVSGASATPVKQTGAVSFDALVHAFCGHPARTR
jgi:hypothetical protein